MSEQPDFRVLFESAPDQYLVLDPELRIVAASDAYLAATMTRREEIVGRGVFDVFPEDPGEAESAGMGEVSASFERVLRDRVPDSMAVLKYHIRRPAEEGGGFEVRYWSPRNVPVLDEHQQLRYILNRVEDVTEFVRLKEHGSEQDEVTSALRKRTEQMEAEILRRSAELRDTNDALRAANEAKNEFLSRMSHELRTPLAAVMGFGELLTFAELDVEHREWAATILKAGQHLLDLVNEVLDISRLEAGEFSISLESVAIKPLLDDVLELVAPLAEGCEVTIHAPTVRAGSGYVYADRQRLKQVVINLLSNAIKYNRHGGEVDVLVEAPNQERLQLTVTDTGNGIDPDALSKLFTPFERLDAASSDVEGTGLGLALSRNLLEAMGGSITARSTPGEGTSFTVELGRGEPIAVHAVAEEDRALLASRAYTRERRLLYVEDTVANVRLIEQILRSRPSVRLLPAMLGGLGLELARKHQPDLILLDLHLPDIGGEQVLAQLRADARTREIPVVILSADATEHTRGPPLDAGANAYLTKPIGVRQLLATVDRYLGD